jgi:hypothetical protein
MMRAFGHSVLSGVDVMDGWVLISISAITIQSVFLFLKFIRQQKKALFNDSALFCLCLHKCMLKHNMPILWKKEKMGIFTLDNDATGFCGFMSLFRVFG